MAKISIYCWCLWKFIFHWHLFNCWRVSDEKRRRKKKMLTTVSRRERERKLSRHASLIRDREWEEKKEICFCFNNTISSVLIVLIICFSSPAVFVPVVVVFNLLQMGFWRAAKQIRPKRRLKRWISSIINQNIRLEFTVTSISMFWTIECRHNRWIRQNIGWRFVGYGHTSLTKELCRTCRRFFTIRSVNNWKFFRRHWSTILWREEKRKRTFHWWKTETKWHQQSSYGLVFDAQTSRFAQAKKKKWIKNPLCLSSFSFLFWHWRRTSTGVLDQVN